MLSIASLQQAEYIFYSGLVVPIRVPTMGKIELLNFLLGIIINIR